MKTLRSGWCLIVFGLVAWRGFALNAAPVPAFPGAEAFQPELCTHGRGGRVLVVTSLADNRQGRPKEGTFRWACETVKEPRVIVFAVGGVLLLEKEVTVAPNVYIAGQTAPGDGLTVARAGLKLGSNTLVRHVRFRLGDQMPGAALTKRDGFEAQGDNILVDHCSIAWSTDESFRVNGGRNIALSWCFFGEGLHITRRAEMHNYGPALEPNFETGGVTTNLAFHHCLLNGFAARSPLIGNGDRAVHLLFANNVIYNYGGMKYPPVHTYAPKLSGPKAGAAFGRVDVVANYFKEGPVTPAGSPVVQVHGTYPTGGLHLDGNLAAAQPASGPGEWSRLVADADDPGVLARRAAAAHNAGHTLRLTGAAQAFDDVLARAGATFPRRDAVDERFARDVRSGTAFRGVTGARAGGGYAAYYDYIFADPADVLKYHVEGQHRNLGMKLTDLDPVPGGREYFAAFTGAAAPPDADADGLPDAWETARGFDPKKADSTRVLPSGYTAIEEYVNGLVPADPR